MKLVGNKLRHITIGHYPVALQILILGLIFNCSGTMVNIIAAYFFESAKKWISSHPTVLKIQQKITGLILIGLGVRLAVFEKA